MRAGIDFWAAKRARQQRDEPIETVRESILARIFAHASPNGRLAYSSRRLMSLGVCGGWCLCYCVGIPTCRAEFSIGFLRARSSITLHPLHRKAMCADDEELAVSLCSLLAKPGEGNGQQQPRRSTDPPPLPPQLHPPPPLRHPVARRLRHARGGQDGAETTAAAAAASARSTSPLPADPLLASLVCTLKG